MTKSISRLVPVVLLLAALGIAQDPAKSVPKEVLERKASIVSVRTIPAGGTVKIDGVPAPSGPFMLLKKDKPRILRFELAGYKAVEKEINPGEHYVIGIGVDFAHKLAVAKETDQPPGWPAISADTRAGEAAITTPASASSASPASGAAAPPASTSATPGGPEGSQQVPSPFGFEYGMTKEQALKKLGRSAVVKDSGINVVLNTAPNPHPDFEAYVLAFSPEKGLLKITAVSKNVETSDDGSELRAKFSTFLSALQEKYGQADKDFDFCKSNDVECRSQYFMMTLMEKNRYLNSFWSSGKAHLPPHLSAISIEAVALGINKGYVDIAYEFDGWDNFVDEQNKKKNSSF